MNTLRSALIWALMFLTIALMGPVHIFCALFVDRTGAMSYRIATQYLRFCLFYMGMKLRVEGRENVPEEGSFIVMPNHRSWWDIPAVQLAIFPRQLRFIYKKQLEMLPVLGWCIRAGGHIGIDREDRDSAVRVLRGVARRFSGHFSLVIFPEGTRSPGRHLLRFKRGGFHLSRELELPVIPVSISGSQVIQSRHTMNFTPGTVTIRFHSPVKAADFPNLDAMIARVKADVFGGLLDGVPEPEGAAAPARPVRGRSAPPPSALLLAGALGVTGLLAAPTAARALPATDPDTLAALLRQAGVDPAEVVVDPVGRRLAPIPRFSALALAAAAQLAPLRAPALLRGVADAALDELTDPAGALIAAAAAQDHPVADPRPRADVTLAAPPHRPEARALYDAIAGFYDDGKRLDGKKRDDLRRFVQVVPELEAGAAAELIRAVQEALAWQKQAFRSVPVGRNVAGRGGLGELVMTWLDNPGAAPPEPVRARIETLQATTDFEALNQGATNLACALTRLAGFSPAGRPFAFAWDTPYGRIALNRGGNDRYEGDYLLIVDLDGDDTYLGGGRVRGPEQAVSVLLDLQGNDTYAPADSSSPGPGGAIGGIALIDDRGGDDHYRAWRLGLGAGAFGVGFLLDRAGADTLEALTASQGAGFFGLGVLADLQGDDVYRLARAGQGCGGPGGVGWLLDRGGDDAYSAVEEARHGLSAPGVTGPLSQLQGCAFGAGAAQARGWPGGFGCLADGEGHDRYSAGREAQGSARDAGIGALVDLAGDDDYQLAGHGQGAASDEGVALLLDSRGRDRYRCGAGAGQGMGEGLGLGICVDELGDDSWELPENGLGGAPGPGLGLFVDGAGDDRYTCADPGSAFGSAEPPCACERPLNRQFVRRGFFLDLSGLDTYPETAAPDAPRNRAVWRRLPADGPRWLIRGVGIDRP